ncbi:MAG: EAL domain-containing protein, partial [Thermoanaerobaculia bacterium]
LGTPLSQTIVPERYRAMHERGMKRFLGSGGASFLNRRIEIKARRKDGSEIDVELAISPMRRGDVFEFSAFIRDITDRKRHETLLDTQAGITRILAESGTFTEALPRLLSVICEGLDWDTGSHWSVDADAQVLTLAHFFSRKRELAHLESRVGEATTSRGDGFAGRVWATGQPLWIEDVSPQPGEAAAPAGGDGSGAVLAFPILVSGDVTGVLEFTAREARPLDPGMLGTLADLGGRIGQFIMREQAVDGLRRLVKAVETIQLGVIIAEMSGRILYCNSAMAEMHGYAVDELLGQHQSLFSANERRATPRPLPTTLEIRSWRRERVSKRKDGSTIPVQLTSDIVCNSAGVPIGSVTCCEEISDRRRAEEALRASEMRYRLLFERNLAGVYRVSTDGRVLECNESFWRILGYASREELMGDNAVEHYFDPADRELVLSRLKSQGTLTNHELRLRRRDGGVLWVLENETLLRGAPGEPDLIEGTLIDITDRKRAEEQIEFHAFHDALTGLPNRVLLKDRLRLALFHAHREKRILAVMFLDLDHFKVINDTLGHSAGDLLLQSVAERLQACVREDDTVARLGGDEFVLLLPNIRGVEDAARLAESILATLQQPFQIAAQELYVSASIGIGIFPNDGNDVETLFKNADAAMYRAKELGRNGYHLSTPHIERIAKDRLALETRLHKVLANQELIVHYQPQIEIQSGRIVGMEALLRWQHPERGLILPGEFISVAEEIGMILPIGEWVLRTACERARSWQVRGEGPTRVAVNLSVRQFRQGGLLKTVESVLAETGLSPELLELEITESIAMQNFEITVPILRRLSDMGVAITIDDFGTGYSSLSYLKLLPIHRLKIDQSFIAGIGQAERDVAIVRAIIGMAHSLGLRVIAEGVETREQLSILRALECDEFQGYLLSRAVPDEDLESLVEQNGSSRWAAGPAS